MHCAAGEVELVSQSPYPAANDVFTFDRGDKRYEIANHLGNVLAVVSDRKIAVTSSSNDWLFDHYLADLWSVSDCQPFGMAVLERSWAAEDYRFGFNGKENDGEWDAQDYGGRIYMPKQARWISPDPLAELRAWLSAYNFVQNNPIGRIDPSGLLDDWVLTKDGSVLYDSRVVDQASATHFYGQDAEYRAVGYNYKGESGTNVVLGDHGFYTDNGTLKLAPDLAESALAEAQKKVAEVQNETVA